MTIIIFLLYVIIGIVISIFFKVFISPELVYTNNDKYLIIFGWIVVVPIYCIATIVEKLPYVVDYFSDRLAEFLKEIKK